MLILAPHRRNHGFSLIELMVAVALFGVLATLAVPAYRDMIQNNQIRNAAESIQTGVQLARAEAVKRNASVQLTMGASNSSSWTVGCPTVTANCPAMIQSRAIGDGSTTSVTVTPSNTGPYVFNSLGVLASPAPTAANGFIALNVTHSTAGLRSLRVVIGVGGSSRMCDPALATTDVRSCPP